LVAEPRFLAAEPRILAAVFARARFCWGDAIALSFKVALEPTWLDYCAHGGSTLWRAAKLLVPLLAAQQPLWRAARRGEAAPATGGEAASVRSDVLFGEATIAAGGEAIGAGPDVLGGAAATALGHPPAPSCWGGVGAGSDREFIGASAAGG
jgi:hypothetical protein